MVPLSSKPFPILALEQMILRNASAQQKQDQVCQKYGITCNVPGRLLCKVYIAAHYTLKVSPADKNPDCHSSLVYSFEVVRGP